MKWSVLLAVGDDTEQPSTLSRGVLNLSTGPRKEDEKGRESYLDARAVSGVARRIISSGGPSLIANIRRGAARDHSAAQTSPNN